MEPHKRLLLSSKAWVKERVNVQPDYFARHAASQSPEFLWIGCSDSRVPAEEITGAEPGELFVHRNIANMVKLTDLNLLSILQYAVEVIKVKHIVVCGHYNCGGVKYAMSEQGFGPINKWLQNLRNLYGIHKHQIDSIADPQRRWDRLAEVNVSEQLHNLARTDIVQRAWQDEQRPLLHGWLYDLRIGSLRELAVVSPDANVDRVYRFQSNAS